MPFPATFSGCKEAPVRSKSLDEMIRALAVKPYAMASTAAGTNEAVLHHACSAKKRNHSDMAQTTSTLLALRRSMLAADKEKLTILF